MIDEAHIPVLYNAFRDRYTDWDQRKQTIDQVLCGDFSVFDADGENIESRSPNLIQVALEDTAEAAGQMPTIRITPAKPGPRARELAARQEKVACGYFTVSNMDVQIL